MNEHIKEDKWVSEEKDSDIALDETDDGNNVSSTNNSEQTKPSLANQKQSGEAELQYLPLPTLLTDSDFSSNPYLEEQVETDSNSYMEEQVERDSLAEKEEATEGDKGTGSESTTRKSFSLQGIRVTVREGGGRRWKQGSETKSIHLVRSGLKTKPVQVSYESEDTVEGVNKELELDNLETVVKSDSEDSIDDNNLADLISRPEAKGEKEENIVIETERGDATDSEEESVEVKLKSSSDGGGIGGAWVGDSDKRQAGSGTTMLPSLLGGQQQQQGGRREEREEASEVWREAGKDSELGSGLEHFLRVGAIKEQSTDNSFLDSEVLEKNVVETSFSSTPEKIHPLLLWQAIPCLVLLLVTF